MNTFGASAKQYPLVDGRSVREYRQRFRRDGVSDLDQAQSSQSANSVCITSGCRPARGWVLLDRYSYDQIPKYSTALVLNLGDTDRPDNVGPLQGLSIVQARCVTRGLSSDPSALYLVELTDARGILSNRWFQYPTYSAYNIRTPAYPQTFFPDTMNAGTTWTWATMLRDLWNQSGLLGTWPGLPSSPQGTPEGFWFSGVPVWRALCDVLDHLGMVVVCDLQQSPGSQYTIVSEGAADTVFAAMQQKYTTNLEDDLEWIDTGAGRVPAQVVVYFRRRNSVYGTEETVTYRNDSMAQQWSTKSAYSVTVSAPSTFAGGVGTHYLWSDFTVRYDQDSTPLAADVVTAGQIAAERVTQYYDRTYSGGYMTQVYAGALPFVTGSMVGSVRHYLDDGRGWKTEVVRGSS